MSNYLKVIDFATNEILLEARSGIITVFSDTNTLVINDIEYYISSINYWQAFDNNNVCIYVTKK